MLCYTDQFQDPPPVAEHADVPVLKGGMRWKGCMVILLLQYGRQPLLYAAARLPAFYVWRLISLSSAFRPKIAGCRRITAVPCLGSQQPARVYQAKRIKVPAIECGIVCGFSDGTASWRPAVTVAFDASGAAAAIAGLGLPGLAKQRRKWAPRIRRLE
jgi:hypothetical protein